MICRTGRTDEAGTFRLPPSVGLLTLITTTISYLWYPFILWATDECPRRMAVTKFESTGKMGNLLEAERGGDVFDRLTFPQHLQGGAQALLVEPDLGGALEKLERIAV